MMDGDLILKDSLYGGDWLEVSYIDERVYIEANEQGKQATVAIDLDSVLALIEYLTDAVDKGLVEDDE